MKERLKGHSFVIETYGCQMNRADSGIMETLLDGCGMHGGVEERDADVIIMNTCSVREHAESRVCSSFGVLRRRFGTDWSNSVIWTRNTRSTPYA